MRRIVIASLILTLGLSGCARISASKFNPLNWFSGAGAAAPAVLYVAPEDQRVLVAQVLSMKVEPNANGAIVRATGLPPTQGWWRAELVEVPQDQDDRLVFEFRLYPPVTPAPAGTQASREVTVATDLSNVELDGIRVIQVQGAGNALSSKR